MGLRIMALTPKQDRFTREYLIDLNGTQAAIRAGYSRHTARVQASDLLLNPDIKAAIQEGMAERAAATATDAAWVLKRLRDEADADINDCYGDSGELLPIDDWPLIWRTGLMVAIETEELTVDGVRMGTVRKVKQSDRIKRLELIGRHVGVQAFKDNVEVNVTDGLADRVQRAKDRANAAAAAKLQADG